MTDMIRKNFYLSKEQHNFLSKIGTLTISEHIRRAIDEYINRLQKLLVSTSPSKRGVD